MKKWAVMISIFLFFMNPGVMKMWAQDQGPAQKRILMERGEKVKGQRLALVKKVVEKYEGCRVLSEGNELTGLIINGKTYQDFTLVIRDAKRMIIVVTADGIVSFDY
ncbi:MAG: hypothetical protein HY882_12890 [Deltaproteobacteria bacterium]|nr:hypothetical protein [Deltaproteobacteria bacterium]